MKTNKPLAFSVIALAISVMACGMQASTGATLANALPTQTAKPLAIATPTQETAVTVGNWHIRSAANADAPVIGYAMDGAIFSIIVSDGDWLLVQIIDENPAECLTGYIHRSAAGK